MTSSANPAEFEAWNGDSGHRWVASADRRDQVLAPVAAVLLTAAALSTRGAAPRHRMRLRCYHPARSQPCRRPRPGDRRRHLSTDARPRAPACSTTLRSRRSTFVRGDVETHVFDPGTFDADYQPLRHHVFRPRSRVHQPVRRARGPTDGSASQPGNRSSPTNGSPFPAQLSFDTPNSPRPAHPTSPACSPNRIQTVYGAVLDAAGFVDITIEATTVTFTLGDSVDDAVEHLADSGPGRAMLETIPEGPARGHRGDRRCARKFSSDTTTPPACTSMAGSGSSPPAAGGRRGFRRLDLKVGRGFDRPGARDLAMTLVLVTNDDGVDAVGLQRLAVALADDGRFDVQVVAPDGDQSGTGAAVGATGPANLELAGRAARCPDDRSLVPQRTAGHVRARSATRRVRTTARRRGLREATPAATRLRGSALRNGRRGTDRPESSHVGTGGQPPSQRFVALGHRSSTRGDRGPRRCGSTGRLLDQS